LKGHLGETIASSLTLSLSLCFSCPYFKSSKDPKFNVIEALSKLAISSQHLDESR